MVQDIRNTRFQCVGAAGAFLFDFPSHEGDYADGGPSGCGVSISGGLKMVEQSGDGLSGDRAKIAGMSLTELRDHYRADLHDDYVAFWKAHGVDMDVGGFMCEMDHDGTLVTTNKSMWYQGRGLWTHTFLYNNFGDEWHLEASRKAVGFMLKFGRDDNGDWVHGLDAQGNVISPPDGIGYTGLFVAEGLMEYARATGESEPMDLAVESFWRACEIYDDQSRQSPQGYVPNSYPGMRLQGFEMVTVVLLSQLVQEVEDPKLQSRLSQAVEVVLEKFWNPEYSLNNEILYHSYDRPHDENEDFIYLGHAIETMWMLLHEAIRAQDQSLFNLAADRLRRHMEVAWDDVYGGFFRAMHVNGALTYDKVLWLQEEVLIGTMILMEHTDWAWPVEWFNRTFHYVQEKFPLKKYGYALWQMGGDRKVSYQPHTSRKGNYHHPRHLMHNLLAIDRMIERNGKPSDLWGSR